MDLHTGGVLTNLESFLNGNGVTINSSSANHQLLQTVMDENQQLKQVFSRYMNESEGKLRESNEKNKVLRDCVESYQRRVLELLAEKRAVKTKCSKTNNKFLQEFYNGLQSLLQKVIRYAQEGSVTLSNDPDVNLDGEEERSRAGEGLLGTSITSSRLQNLEAKIISLEETMGSLISACQVTQESQSQMKDLTGKLDRIMEQLQKNNVASNQGSFGSGDRCEEYQHQESLGGTSEEVEMILPDLPTVEDESQCEDVIIIPPASKPDAIKDPNQESKFEGSTETIPESSSYPEPLELHCSIKSALNATDPLGVGVTPIENNSHIVKPTTEKKNKPVLKRKFSQNQKILKQILRKKAKLIFGQRKPCKLPTGNDDAPPLLSPPGKIENDPNRRLDSMPILYPQCSSKKSSKGKENVLLISRPSAKPKEKPAMALVNYLERLQIELQKGSTVSGDFVGGYNLISSQENVEVEEKRDHLGKVRPSRSFSQIKKDIHGIKRERVPSHSIDHSRDFSKPGYSCMCGAKFTGAGGLYVHQVKMLEVEKFTCDVENCGKRFHYFSGLKAHRKSTHKMEFTQQVGCSRCGQVFTSKKERQGHVDSRGQTCWLSGSYQSKDWEQIRKKRLESSFSPAVSGQQIIFVSSQN